VVIVVAVVVVASPSWSPPPPLPSSPSLRSPPHTSSAPPSPSTLSRRHLTRRCRRVRRTVVGIAFTVAAATGLYVVAAVVNADAAKDSTKGVLQ
jgi:hypothetical protein